MGRTVVRALWAAGKRELRPKGAPAPQLHCAIPRSNRFGQFPGSGVRPWSQKWLQVVMRRKNKMPRQRLSPSSPSERPIHFGEGLAETGQARQRLGVSCDVLSTYQSGPDARYWAQTRRSLSTVFIILGPPMWSAASCSNRYEACRTALSSQFGLQTLNQYIAVSAGST